MSKMASLPMPSRIRSTKLFNLLLFLQVFTYFTFAQEAIANPGDFAYWIRGRSKGRRSWP